MLNSVRIQNFQSHIDSLLEFSPGVNIIAGESNSGKTAIIRALRLISDNRPLGDNFVRDGQKFTDVGLVKQDTQDRYFISRKRGASVNEYLITSDKGLEIHNTSPGTAVPEEVSDVLNLSDLNVQQQHSPYFLVFDSPGQVALYIRSIADLDEIDRLISVFQKLASSAKKDKKYLSNELKDVEEQINIISRIPLEEYEKFLSEYIALIEEENCVQQEMDNISVLIHQLIDQLEKHIDLPENLDESISQVESLISEYSEVFIQCETLTKLCESFKEASSVTIQLPENIDLKISDIETIIVQYNNIESNISILIDLQSDLQEIQNEIFLLDEKIKMQEVEETELLEGLQDCPSCGQTLSSDAKLLLIKTW